MTIGPVEYIIVGFPGNDFTGAIAPVLAKLIDSKTIRVLDLLFIGKDGAGNVLSFEFDDLDALGAYGDLDAESGGIISEADIADAAEALEPNIVVRGPRVGRRVGDRVRHGRSRIGRRAPRRRSHPPRHRSSHIRGPPRSRLIRNREKRTLP